MNKIPQMLKQLASYQRVYKDTKPHHNHTDLILNLNIYSLLLLYFLLQFIFPPIHFYNVRIVTLHWFGRSFVLDWLLYQQKVFQITMSKQIDLHVLLFYEPKKLLGSGAYGHVWKVVDKSSKQVFALKKIFDAFQNSTDAQRTYRQISLLHQMQHRNIVKLHKVIKAKNKKDLYLVFQFMESDLHSLVGQSILTPTHITFVIYQTLKALKYVHSAQLIHRDLKPSNILINSQCQIKLCDFGLARSLAHEEHQQNILSEQVATRWYRSPEMLLSSRDYSKPTDIWSVGCIAAELMIGQPIFQGNSTLNQLQKIIQFTGIPSKYSVDSLKSDVAQNIINNLTVRKKSIKDYFRNSTGQDSQLINITMRMLDFNPSKRPTIQELLKEQIFRKFQTNSDQQEEVCQKFIVPEIDDNIKLTLQEYRKIIYKDIERRYPEFNDATRIKSIYAGTQKHTSLMEKNRKKSVQNNNHTSIHTQPYLQKSLQRSLQKSLPTKAIQNIPTELLNKKSVSRKQFSKNIIKSSQSKAESLKSKFLKANKIKKSQQLKQPSEQAIQSVKPHQLMNQEYLKNAQQRKKRQKKTEKQSRQVNQASPNKDLLMKREENASIYKQELKRMKSNKKLVKNKILKPKFTKTSEIQK